LKSDGRAYGDCYSTPGGANVHMFAPGLTCCFCGKMTRFWTGTASLRLVKPQPEVEGDARHDA
jgi:hypothetical protein